MTISQILSRIALVCVCWGAVSAVFIASYLSKRGHRISVVFFRLMLIKYIQQYKEITREETGRTGPWFYHFVISMNSALLLVILGLILR